jgi:hypothetical protein
MLVDLTLFPSDAVMDILLPLTLAWFRVRLTHTIPCPSLTYDCPDRLYGPCIWPSTTRDHLYGPSTHPSDVKTTHIPVPRTRTASSSGQAQGLGPSRTENCNGAPSSVTQQQKQQLRP